MPPTPATLIIETNDRLLNHGDANAAETYFSADYVVHLANQAYRGTAFVTRFVNGLRKAFPDLTVEVEILVQDADRVGWRRTFRGTHQRAYQGFPPTKQPLAWQDVVVSRVENGKIAEEWTATDLAEHLLAARHAQTG